jgi:hypothetical protein
MANNDKLKQLISNLQNLTDLAVSMKDSDLYPVSFFSKAFDLIQKIQKGFHTLEAEQVEVFASQMKKHQDLITSIHRQMRNIENIPESGMSLETPQPETVPEQSAEPANEYIIPQKVNAGAVESDNTGVEKPPKAPIFSRIIDREKISAPPPAEKKTVQPLKKATWKKAGIEDNVALISTPVIIPDKKTAETNPEEETKNNISHQPLSLNDAIEKNKLSDLRKAFSLNDRFRYQRILFGGRQDVMDKVISDINNHHSLKESLSYLKEELRWDISDPTVNDFIKKLEIRFL